MVFIPDAEAPWVWAWCADAPGYQRAAAELRDERPDTVRVLLKVAAQGRRCLAKPRSLYDIGAQGSR
jgi:hypothetical protein